MSKNCQSTYVQKSVPAETWVCFREVRILRRDEEDLGTSVLRNEAAKGINVPSVWRILHEQSFYPYPIQRMQVLTPDHRARAVFCMWLVVKCVVNTQFAVNTPFIDQTGFTRDGILIFRNTHVWADDNPQPSVASIYQHPFSINVINSYEQL
jgi:hypothetical protein